MKIDIHTHILPPELPKFKDRFGYGGFIFTEKCSGSSDVNLLEDSGKFFRRVKQNCFDPKKRIQECDEINIDVQVLSTLPVMFCYWAKAKDGLEISKMLNDHIAGVVSDNPKRFVGLATVPLQDPELAVKEAERCIKNGFKGFQIGSHVNKWNLSDPELFPFYEACEDLGAALFVHPWEMMGQDRMPKYWLPWLVGMPAETTLAICSMIFGGVFEKFPKLRVAFAHGGGAFPMTWPRIQQGFDTRPDLCAVDNKISPKKYLGHFYVDSLVHDGKVLQFMIDLFGADKICLGSDYPFPLGELVPGELIHQSNFDKKTKEWLNFRSAMNWLGVEDGFTA